MDPHKWVQLQKALHRATDSNTLLLEDEKSIQSGIIFILKSLQF